MFMHQRQLLERDAVDGTDLPPNNTRGTDRNAGAVAAGEREGHSVVGKGEREGETDNVSVRVKELNDRQFPGHSPPTLFS